MSYVLSAACCLLNVKDGDCVTESPQPATPADLLEAAARLLPGHRDIEPVPGYADLIRVNTVQGWTRVTRWQEGVTAERIATTHAIFERGVEAEIRCLPSPYSGPNGEASIALPGGHRYEAREWLPGAPVFREEQIPDLPLPEFAPLDHLAELAANIGNLHTASQRIVDQRKLTPVPLTVLHRSIALAGQDERRLLSGKDRTYPPIRIWQRASERIIPAAADAIGLLQAGEGKRFVATHGNLWPEHVLYTRSGEAMRLSGITGWSRLSASSPLVDLAQIVARHRGWSQDAAEVVLESYQSVAPLLPEERRAFPMIVGLDLLAVAGPLLISRVAAATGELRMGGTQHHALQVALERTLAALDKLVPLLGGYDSASPKRGRKWVYRDQPGGRGRPPGRA